MSGFPTLAQILGYDGDALDALADAIAVLRLPSAALAVTAVKAAAYTLNANELMRGDISGGSFTATLPNAPADGTLCAVKLVAVQASPIGSATAAGTLNALTIQTQGSDVLNVASGSTSVKLYGKNQSVTLQYVAAGAIWAIRACDSGAPSPWCAVGPITGVSQGTTVGYCIDFNGRVVLRGVVTNSSGANIATTTTLFTLPFAPKDQARQWDLVESAVSGFAPQIDTSGNVKPFSTWGNGGTGSFDGKEFLTT